MIGFFEKTTELSKYHLLSSILGMISGASAIATAIKYLFIGSEEGSITIPRKLTWAELASLSTVLVVGGLLVVLGSLLVLRRKNRLGAVLVLIPGVFYSSFAKPYGLPYLIALMIDYEGCGVEIGEYILGWLACFALPIASSVLSLQKLRSKKEEIILKELAYSKRQLYAKASSILGMISGVSALVSGMLLAFNFGRFWPLSASALLLIPTGTLVILGGYFVLKRRIVLGALLILVPGLVSGVFGLPMFLVMMGRSFGIVFIASYFVGFALPIASYILALYSR